MWIKEFEELKFSKMELWKFNVLCKLIGVEIVEEVFNKWY